MNLRKLGFIFLLLSFCFVLLFSQQAEISKSDKEQLIENKVRIEQLENDIEKIQSRIVQIKTDQYIILTEQIGKEVEKFGKKIEDNVDSKMQKAIESNKSEIADIEYQKLRNNFFQYLEDKDKRLNNWLTIVSIVVAVFGVFVPLILIFAYWRIAESLGNKTKQAIVKMELEITNAVTYAKEKVDIYVDHAKSKSKEIDEVAKKVNGVHKKLRIMNAENMEENEDVINDVSDDPEATPLEKAITDAYKKQSAGEYTEAIIMWKSILRIYDLNKNQIANFNFNIAFLWQLLFEQTKDTNQLMQSIFYFLESLIYEISSATYINLGVIESKLGNYKKAISYFDIVIELNENYYMGYNNRGNTYRLLEEYGNALKDLNKAIALNSNKIDAFLNRGLTYNSKEKYESAIDDFNFVIKKQSNNIDARNGRYLASFFLKKWALVIEDVVKLNEIGIKNVKSYNALGIAYGKVGVCEKAISSYNNALSIEPKNLSIIFNLLESAICANKIEIWHEYKTNLVGLSGDGSTQGKIKFLDTLAQILWENPKKSAQAYVNMINEELSKYTELIEWNTCTFIDWTNITINNKVTQSQIIQEIASKINDYILKHNKEYE